MSEPITQVDTHLVFNGVEVRKVKLEAKSAAPSEPEQGQLYFDTTKKEVGYYNGAEWIYDSNLQLKGDLGGTAAEPHVVNLHLSGDTSIGHKLTKLTTPTENEDAANKSYVDKEIASKINGLSWKKPVVCVTQEALPAYTQSGKEATGKLEANAVGILTIDGHNVKVNDSVLVTTGAKESDNGIYTCTQEGTAGAKFALTRREDATTGAQVQNLACIIEQGLAGKDKEYTLETVGPITVDTTSLKFVEFQAGTAVTGDEVLTKREGHEIVAIVGQAEAAAPGEGEVSASSVGVARVKKFTLKGNAVATEFTVTHSLNDERPVVQAYNHLNEPLVVGVSITSASALKVVFPKAPAKGELIYVRVVA